MPDINALGQVLFTSLHVIQLLIAGLILLLAVIGAAVLTVTSVFDQNLKKQVFFKQVSRSYKNILVL